VPLSNYNPNNSGPLSNESVGGNNNAALQSSENRMLINQIQQKIGFSDDSKSAESAESDLILSTPSLHNSSERRAQVLNIQFNPSEYGILNQYRDVEEIYSMRVSPTVVSLVTGIGEDSEKVSHTIP
jgi:hypothetical protein